MALWYALAGALLKKSVDLWHFLCKNIVKRAIHSANLRKVMHNLTDVDYGIKAGKNIKSELRGNRKPPDSYQDNLIGFSAHGQAVDRHSILGHELCKQVSYHTMWSIESLLLKADGKLRGHFMEYLCLDTSRGIYSKQWHILFPENDCYKWSDTWINECQIRQLNMTLKWDTERKLDLIWKSLKLRQTTQKTATPQHRTNT